MNTCISPKSEHGRLFSKRILYTPFGRVSHPFGRSVGWPGLRFSMTKAHFLACTRLGPSELLLITLGTVHCSPPRILHLAQGKSGGGQGLRLYKALKGRHCSTFPLAEPRPFGFQHQGPPQ